VEIQFALGGNDVQNVGLCNDPVVWIFPREIHQIQVIPNSARVVQKLTYRDFLAPRVNLGDELLDFIVKGQPTIFGQQYDRHCRELFRHRCDVKY
jgi:hypothetical protein